MTVVLGGHLLLAPAPIAARAVATMLSLMLVRLAHQAARARALRTLALVIGHADKSLHKRRAHAMAQRRIARSQALTANKHGTPPALCANHRRTTPRRRAPKPNPPNASVVSPRLIRPTPTAKLAPSPVNAWSAHIRPRKRETKTWRFALRLAGKAIGRPDDNASCAVAQLKLVIGLLIINFPLRPLPQIGLELNKWLSFS